MREVSTGFASAVEAHKAGRIDEAEHGYRQVLAAQPKHADAWHLLGVIHQQRGRSAASVEHIQRALALSGPQAGFLANLGIALEAAGRGAESVAALEQAVKLEPGSFVAHFALGNSLRGIGRLEDAVERYETALTLQPDNPSAHNNLGNALRDLGRADEAAAHFRRTVALQPQHARAHYNLGLLLRDGDKVEDAAKHFRQALSIVPDMVEARVNLGIVLQDSEQLEQAIRESKKAIARNPADLAASNNLGNALCELGMLHKRQKRLPQAVESLSAATELRPDDFILLNNLANALTELGRAVEAERHLRHAIERAPQLAESHLHLGNALKAQDRFEEAVSAYEIAISLKGVFTKARINLSGALQKLEQYERALKNYEEALRDDPASAEAASGMGVILEALGRLDEALASFQKARELNPDFAEAHRNAAIALLMHGDFKAGWDAYEWRWRYEDSATGWRDFPYPVWQGEGGEGAVLIWGEQGVGDKVLYAGMIPELLARGHKVVIETDARLVELFERSFPGLVAVAKSDPPDPATLRSDIRWHSSIASLGRWLRPDEESFPKRTSYLVPDSQRRLRYRALLEGAPLQSGAGPIVGISWGSSNPRIGQHKSLNLGQWAPILRVPGVRFVDLQYGDTSSARAAVESELGVTIAHIPGLDLREDLDGLAALAAACDLVISVSSTTAHLAAAVGCPTWIMVPATAGSLWYWMQGTDRTPWYPAVTIFRQAKLSQWQEVIAEVEGRLRAFTPGSSA